MQQTFKKNIGAHFLQFNRLLYPTRYVVKLDDEGSPGLQVEFKKDDNNQWVPNAGQDIIEWLDGTSKDIVESIKENEEMAVQQ